MVSPIESLERSHGKRVLVAGSGPAGLAAAEVLAGAGLDVTIAERMPSAGRKLLMAGRGGLNLTHSEPFEGFLTRYGAGHPLLEAALRDFPPSELIGWAEGLGQPTFIGTSGRVFPRAMKASPLLRAWLARLFSMGVRLDLGTRWRGWDRDGRPLLARGDAASPEPFPSSATLLALGGASWPRLGTDGSWQAIFEAAGIETRPLRPSNAGLTINWSPLFSERHAGAPLKRIAVSFRGETQRGEAVVTRHGLEGGAVYALSSAIGAVTGEGSTVTISIDLLPDVPEAEIARRIAATVRKDSLANVLRKAARLSPAEAMLLREAQRDLPRDPGALAALIKSLPLVVSGVSGLDRAISSAGGVPFTAIDGNFMLRARRGTFIAGEMLDWDAPTGGYLLQASIATGRAAARGILRHFADAGEQPTAVPVSGRLGV